MRQLSGRETVGVEDRGGDVGCWQLQFQFQ